MRFLANLAVMLQFPPDMRFVNRGTMLLTRNDRIYLTTDSRAQVASFTWTNGHMSYFYVGWLLESMGLSKYLIFWSPFSWDIVDRYGSKLIVLIFPLLISFVKSEAWFSISISSKAPKLSFLSRLTRIPPLVVALDVAT